MAVKTRRQKSQGSRGFRLPCRKQPVDNGGILGVRNSRVRIVMQYVAPQEKGGQNPGDLAQGARRRPPPYPAEY